MGRSALLFCVALIVFVPCAAWADGDYVRLPAKTANSGSDAAKGMDLTEEDFTVEYRGMTINKNTKLDDVLTMFGHGDEDDHYDNRDGYISSSPTARRFQLKYPNYDDCEIRLVCIENHTRFIEFISLYVPTKRGLRVGDSKNRLMELYGEPDDKRLSDNQLICWYEYFYEDQALSFGLSDNETTVFAIDVVFNRDSEESKSIEEYLKELLYEEL